MDSVKGRIDSAVRELKKCYDNNKDVTLGLQGVESVYNSDIIKKASDILSAIGNEILKICRCSGNVIEKNRWII